MNLLHPSPTACVTLPIVEPLTHHAPDRTISRTPSWFVTGLLYTGFMATGIGIVLPGALLSLLLTRWSLNDQEAGILFFLFFIGSTTGAVLTRGSLPRSIARGCLAAAVGAAFLAIATRTTAFAAITLYGIGLGIVMTSTSLLESRRHPATRAAHITRLNLVWSLGACFGPWFALRGAAVWGPQSMLYAIAALFALTGILVLFCVQHVAATTAPTLGWWKHARSMPVALLLMVPLATGIESAAGGWLAAYSKRSGHTLGVVIGAATCFWGGLLLSRLLQSSRKVAARSVRLSLALNPWLIAAGLALLVSTGNLVFNSNPVFNGNQATILFGALLIGFGVGPMYPSLLALVLERGEGGNAVFVMAGVGAAVFPLFTGLVSGWTGSLRLGLCVPLAGAFVMAWCGWKTSQAESL